MKIDKPEIVMVTAAVLVAAFVALAFFAPFAEPTVPPRLLSMEVIP